MEVWNLLKTSFLERVIPGYPQGSVEALAWCADRLFSTGINARVVEHNLKTLTEKVCTIYYLSFFLKELHSGQWSSSNLINHEAF